MITATLFLLACCAGVYFGIEECERRKANPGGEPWTDRLKRSFRSNLYFLIGAWVAFALYFAGFRKHDIKTCFVEAVLMSMMWTLVVFHKATSLLPRKEK